MFDFLRNLTRSADDRRQEALNAYLDNALSAREQTRLEQQLAADPVLEAELNQLRQVKSRLHQLPRLRAPRNFTLDPAVYGRPASSPAVRLYPFLRTATALTAFMFILALSLTFFNQGGLLTAGEIQDQALEAPVAARVETEAAMESAPAEPEELLAATREVAAPRAEEEAVEEAAAPADDSADGGAAAPAVPIQAATATITATLGITAAGGVDATAEAIASPSAPPLATPAVLGALPQPTVEEPAADSLQAYPLLDATETDNVVPAVQPTETASAEKESVTAGARFLSGWSALQIAVAALGLLLFVLIIATLTLRRRLH